MKCLNLINKKIGCLLVISRFPENDKNGHAKFNCLCDCGQITVILSDNLKRRIPKNCLFCKETKTQNLVNSSIGKKFGKLTILNYDETGTRHNKKYLCECNCEQKTIISAYLSSLKSGKTKSCGCINKENLLIRNKNQKGKNHPRYNHQKSDKERKEDRRYNPEFTEWKQEIKKRDNWTCQISGEKGGRLCAHHLDGWNWCKEKRYDLNNGITISEKIHKLFHSLFGSKNNTKQQFEEFKKQYEIIKNEKK